MSAINVPDKLISEEIEKYMCIVYRIVGICLGIPNDTFSWYYHDDRDQLLSYENITPLEFYENLVKPTFDVDDKVSLICDPRPKNKFGKLYTFDLVGNVKEGSKMLCNNQPIEVLMEACKLSISELQEPVWYSCEVDKKFSSKLGSENLQLHDMQLLFGTDISIPMTKSERILYRDSAATHAMVLTGVHMEENGEVTRWQVENSWGIKANHNGYITMTTEWFKEYVFEVIVDKRILPQCVLDVYNLEPIVLPIWDQFCGCISFVN